MENSPPPSQGLSRSDPADTALAAGADHVLGASPPEDPAGPLSAKGIKVRPLQTLTLGDFRIVRKLGAGAMGAVYLAHQASADRDVALKVLAPELAVRAAFLQRFRREAETMAALQHPNIVACHGVGEHAGFHYLAMEFVDGCSLDRVLDRLGGHFTPADALHVACVCARALGHAHQHGIVHRDLKPQNVMITRYRVVKITDLGLAKPVDQELSLTDTGVGMGTPLYMSPEQTCNAKRADHRSDIYSLGVLLYQCLTGALPFTGESAMEVLRAKEYGVFRPARRLNSEVPPRLDLIVDKMMAKNLKYRYQSCAEMLTDLEGLGLAAPVLSGAVRQACQAAREPPPRAADRAEEILLVEDDPEYIGQAQAALRDIRSPVNLSVVRNGVEASAFLRRRGPHQQAPRPNLILLHYEPGKPDSLEMLRQLKADPDLQDIPVIVLSFSAATEHVLRVYDLQARHCAAEPGELDRVLEMLKTSPRFNVTLVQLPSPHR
jgi:serine/threonine-protein kinase